MDRAPSGYDRLVPTRVAIVDDYEIIVRGLAAMLEPFPQIEVVELALGEPSITSLDVALYDTFGAAEAHLERIQPVIDHPDVGATIVYSANADPRLVDRALGRGARGYVAKSASAEQVVDAIVRVAAGEVVVERGADHPAERPFPGQGFDLTEREAEVLALITQGVDNATIAERLFISPNTVKSRIRGLYRKIGADNRVQAALWGVRHGFEADREGEPSIGTER